MPRLIVAVVRIAGSLRPATMKSSPLCTRLRLHSEIPIIIAKKTPREMPRVHFIYGLPPQKAPYLANSARLRATPVQAV